MATDIVKDVADGVLHDACAHAGRGEGLVALSLTPLYCDPELRRPLLKLAEHELTCALEAVRNALGEGSVAITAKAGG